MAARTYAHRQAAWNLIIPIGALAIPFVMAMMILAGTILGAVLVGIGLGVAYATFGSLHTSVDADEVTAGWTWGWPRRRIPVKHIESHAAVRNRWWHGWGVRLIPGGMLYSVWGLDAIEIHYRDVRLGKARMFRIGTDDVAGLDDAITAARADRH
ncbi:MAG: hypothetical protein AAF081_02740 [Actinomycetota bacterium]